MFIDKPLTLIATEGQKAVLERQLDDSLPTLLVKSATDVVIQGFAIVGNGVVVLNSLNVAVQ